MSMYYRATQPVVKDAQGVPSNKKLIKCVLDCSKVKPLETETYDEALDATIKKLLSEFFTKQGAQPYRIILENVTEMGPKSLTRLGIKHLDTHIRINGSDIPSTNIRRYWAFEIEFDRHSVPRRVAKIPFILDGKPTTIGQYFANYKYGKYADEMYAALKAYNQIRIDKAKELNWVTDWRPIEDFYVEVMLIAMRNPIEVMLYDHEQDGPKMVKVPSIDVKSPSPKTKVEAEYQYEFDMELNAMTMDLAAPEDDILEEMRYYELTVPHIIVASDSKQVTKYHDYTPKSYEDYDVPLGYTPDEPKQTKSGVKYTAYTRVLEEILINPDRTEMQRRYYNRNKERNIPNDIRRDLRNENIKPIEWMNTCHAEADFIKSLSPEDQKLFRALDMETCPVCGESYNIVHGCADLVTDTYHVLPAAIHYECKPSQMDLIRASKNYVNPNDLYDGEYDWDIEILEDVDDEDEIL